MWTFDHKGQLRNKQKPEWCVTWAGGKKKELRLDECDDNATRRLQKTSSFEYVKSKKAIQVTNTENDKKFLIGFDPLTKYERLRLYGVNTENSAVHSFVTNCN